MLERGQVGEKKGGGYPCEIKHNKWEARNHLSSASEKPKTSELVMVGLVRY